MMAGTVSLGFDRRVCPAIPGTVPAIRAAQAQDARSIVGATINAVRCSMVRYMLPNLPRCAWVRLDLQPVLVRRPHMRKPTTAGVLVVLVLIGLGVRVSAQHPGNPLEAMQATLNAISAVLVTGNVVSTPGLSSGAGSEDDLGCIVTNVSASSRSVTFEAFDEFGQSVRTETRDVAPNAQFGVSVLRPFAHCRFTVNNGTKNDVRANIVVKRETDGVWIVSADAR